MIHYIQKRAPAVLAVFLLAVFPSHAIVEPLYCGSCHPEQVSDLNAITHLANFSKRLTEAAEKIPEGSNIEFTRERAISGSCMMCHSYWENMGRFGVINFAIVEAEFGNPDPVKDIYGNTVSPYGAASTQSWVMRIQEQPVSEKVIRATGGVEPWQAGIEIYDYKDADGTRHTRLDYVWSALSAISPGPAAFEILDEDGEGKEGCGTAEKGLCHIASQTFGMTVAGTNSEVFTHETTFTTAQYAAKPVKLCAVCHVFKLPPMKWGGEPWYDGDNRAASGETVQGDPFGFTPTYDMSGDFKLTSSGEDFSVTYRTPDWAHQAVPCMRCHVHAGIRTA